MECSPLWCPLGNSCSLLLLESCVLEVFTPVLHQLLSYFLKLFWFPFVWPCSFTSTCVYLLDTLKQALSLGFN